MNTLLDIIGSTIIGGLIFLIMMNLNTYSATSKFSSDSGLRLQQNASTAASIIDNDLRKIGFNYTQGNPIISAQQQKISFFSDINNKGEVDTVTLTVSDSTVASNTPNPHDKVLYRIINGDTLKGQTLGITNMNFIYKDSLGNATSNLNSIKYIQAEMWFESTEKVDSTYQQTFWEMTVNPRNL
ncbi:MAG: hypothetical protein ACYCVH_14475 [Ignavibacteriaceae bacterium]